MESNQKKRKEKKKKSLSHTIALLEIFMVLKAGKRVNVESYLFFPEQVIANLIGLLISTHSRDQNSTNVY